MMLQNRQSLVILQYRITKIDGLRFFTLVITRHIPLGISVELFQIHFYYYTCIDAKNSIGFEIAEFVQQWVTSNERQGSSETNEN